MEKLTYRQAFDKITEAYIRGEIEPYSMSFCFCGTLCDNKDSWRKQGYKGIFANDTHRDFMYYTGQNYADMERALLVPLIHVNYGQHNYEDALFAGMSAALEVLKEIHRARGEDVDEVPVFTKRELLTPAH